MSKKYAVIFGLETLLPERDLLISQAWGDVPVSYVQDDDDLNFCSFLDLKINKWEMNGQWSRKQNIEPWVRIEILKGLELERYLQSEGYPLPVDAACENLMVFELDEGGGELDDVLLLRLVSVFFGGCKVYRWCDGLKKISEDEVGFVPAQQLVRERLLKCS